MQQLNIVMKSFKTTTKSLDDSINFSKSNSTRNSQLTRKLSNAFAKFNQISIGDLNFSSFRRKIDANSNHINWIVCTTVGDYTNVIAESSSTIWWSSCNCIKRFIPSFELYELYKGLRIYCENFCDNRKDCNEENLTQLHHTKVD